MAENMLALLLCPEIMHIFWMSWSSFRERKYCWARDQRVPTCYWKGFQWIRHALQNFWFRLKGDDTFGFADADPSSSLPKLRGRPFSVTQSIVFQNSLTWFPEFLLVVQRWIMSNHNITTGGEPALAVMTQSVVRLRFTKEVVSDIRAMKERDWDLRQNMSSGEMLRSRPHNLEMGLQTRLKGG